MLALLTALAVPRVVLNLVGSIHARPRRDVPDEVPQYAETGLAAYTTLPPPFSTLGDCDGSLTSEGLRCVTVVPLSRVIKSRAGSTPRQLRVHGLQGLEEHLRNI